MKRPSKSNTTGKQRPNGFCQDDAIMALVDRYHQAKCPHCLEAEGGVQTQIEEVQTIALELLRMDESATLWFLTELFLDDIGITEKPDGTPRRAAGSSPIRLQHGDYELVR